MSVSKGNKMYRKFPYKVLTHILAISLFMFGVVLIHVRINLKYTGIYMRFFGMVVTKNFVFDMGIFCMAIGFFIEFFLTFRPIYIATKK